MTVRLTPAHSRLAALAILALLAVLGGALLVAPVLAQHRHYDERIAVLREQLERYIAVAQTSAGSERALRYLKQRAPAQRYYLRSSGESLASAELQQHAKRVIERHGGQLVSTQVLAGRPAAKDDAARLRLSMRGDIRTLQRVLHELETGRPVLFLDQVSIAGYGARVTQAQTPRAPVLTIRFDLSGYMRAAETK